MATNLITPKTFGQMLSELRSRVKLHATLGNTPALESILSEANEYVFEELAGCSDGLPYKSTLTLSANVASYPMESDEGQTIARGSVREVWIEQGDTHRTPLPQGISHAMRADEALRDIPQAWDTSMQDDEFTLEVWPTPEQAYRMFIDHNRVVQRFSQTADLPSAPSRLVFGYALSVAKAHYGQPDAQIAGQAFQTMLYNEKYKQRELRRFIPPGSERRAPQVVRTANGYRQV
jgi:hypothetical protein